MPPPFRAIWNDRNIHLQEPHKTLSQKIAQVAWNVLSIVILPLGIARAIGWVVHFIAKKMILPSAWFYPNQILQRAKGIFNVCCRNLQNQFLIQKHKIFTPDGVRLNALQFRHRLADENTPTVLFYQSNASISQLGIYLWLVEEAARRNSVCNFVVFDYRGVGSSKGDAESIRDLLIDGDTALQFVKDHLHVPPHLIHWYTWSLGGGIGSNIKAMYPECTGPLINERSFSSLRAVGENIIPTFLKPFLFWLPWAAEKEGWKLEVPLNKLRERTLILYHRKDPTIPYAASAHKADESIQALELYQTEEQIEQAQGRMVDHHFEELGNYYVAPGLKADQAAANFILPPAAAVAAVVPAA
jgi:hypothetical protein